MERVWAPWRGEYLSNVVEKEGDDCVFCSLSLMAPSKDNLMLFSAKSSFVLMNKYPYNSGHIMVIPKRHCDALEQLPDAEYRELSELLRESIKVVKKVYNPQGCNIGMNLGRVAGAGIAGHLHYHIVPRWGGDTNFMPLFAEVKVISEHIFDSYDRLYKVFSEVVG